MMTIEAVSKIKPAKASEYQYEISEKPLNEEASASEA